MEQYQCKTPVAFIFFNRLDEMREVLEQIAKVEPPKVYLIADGPRNEEEKIVTKQCRELAESCIDWECEVVKLYSDINLGCCNRIYSGISYALSREEKLIILEDDIVPSLSFFRFQDEMLMRYNENKEIFSISGFNHYDYVICGEQDYYYVHFFDCWGWGTWADRWKSVDMKMEKWKEIKGHPKRLKLYEFDRKLGMINYRCFDRTYLGLVDSWAYRVSFWLTQNRLYSVMPRQSLVRCIGFGGNATHSTKGLKEEKVVAHEILFPLKEPKQIENFGPWMKEWANEANFHFYRRQALFFALDLVNYPLRIVLKKELVYKKEGKVLFLALKKINAKKIGK